MSDHASRSCNLEMIRVVKETPRSARINACSSSSQSIGLPANCCASASKNFTELDRIYKIDRIENRGRRRSYLDSNNPVNPVLLSVKTRPVHELAGSNLSEP